LDLAARCVGDRPVYTGESTISTPLVSVVIPTYRRPQLLERCLRAVLAQTLDPGLFEIIVVDDDPAGRGTRELVERWQARLASPDMLPMDESAHSGTQHAPGSLRYLSSHPATG
jgi:cellulose synthase/poly-beta-1,6-N-acetylglucosamine synthase-like glycosyltransferase